MRSLLSIVYKPNQRYDLLAWVGENTDFTVVCLTSIKQVIFVTLTQAIVQP